MAKAGILKKVAIGLAGILLIGAGGGITAHVIANNYNPVTLDGKKKTVVGFKGMTNASGVLTYTGDYAKYNDQLKEAEEKKKAEKESAADSAADTTEETSEEVTLYTLTTTGSYVEMASPLDNEFPYNEIKTVKDKHNNSFTAFPKMYMSYSYNRAGYLDGVSFSNYKVDDTYFINDAYLKPDGSGEYIDYFYIGQYEASGSALEIYSVPSAQPLVNKTRADVRTAARAYGTAKNYYNGYQQLDITMWDMYGLLVSMYLKTVEVQSVYAGPTDLTAPVTTGTTASIGGMNGWNTSSHAVKFLGVENPYGSVSEWCDGMNFKDSSIYYQSNPNNYSDTVDQTSDVIVEFQRPTSSGYVELLKTGTNAKTQSVIYPAFSVAAPGEGYENDGYWYEPGARVLHVGDSYNSYSKAGLWSFTGSDMTGVTFNYVGGRLCGRDLPNVKAA